MKSRLTEFSFLALAAKKAAVYVLEQNWFADPLEVKSALASFDSLVRSITDDFLGMGEIEYQIRPVEVPKSIVEGKLGRKLGRVHKLRQLSHLPFKAQVSAAAILMMIGEEWDELFGKRDSEGRTILGNRLDCIEIDGSEKFRLGSRTTYRFWADDYSQFVSLTSKRFNRSLEELKGKRRVALVSTDFSSFYPSIDLNRLADLILSSKSLTEVERPHVKKFFAAIQRGMEAANLSGLPQGMISSGFFANIYLHRFDEQIWSEFTAHPALRGKNPEIHFYSRYVDDIRVIVSYDPPKAKPAKKVEKHHAFVALNSFVTKFGLKTSSEKTHLLDLDRNGAKLTEGLLAEHMQDLATKAYGALVPSKSENLARLFELLFSIDSTAERKPASQEVQRNKYNPVIDGPGVRPDSRKRFAAGRFRRLYLTYKDCSEELGTLKNRFVSEMFREWKSDPSQIRLLFYSFDLAEYSDDMIRDTLEFLDDYPQDPNNLEASHWIPFIKASILRTFIERAVKTNLLPGRHF